MSKDFRIDFTTKPDGTTTLSFVNPVQGIVDLFSFCRYLFKDNTKTFIYKKEFILGIYNTDISNYYSYFKINNLKEKQLKEILNQLQLYIESNEYKKVLTLYMIQPSSLYKNVSEKLNTILDSKKIKYSYTGEVADWLSSYDVDLKLNI